MKRLSLSFVRDVSYQIRILFLSSFLLKKTRSAIDDTPISPPPKKSIMITQPAKNSKRITKRRGGYFFFRWSNKTKMRFLYSCLYTTIRKTTNQSTASNNLKIKTVDTQNKRRVGRGKMVFFFFWRNNTTTSITSFTTCYYQTWRDILGSPPPLPYFSCSPKKNLLPRTWPAGYVFALYIFWILNYFGVRQERQRKDTKNYTIVRGWSKTKTKWNGPCRPFFLQ